METDSQRKDESTRWALLGFVGFTLAAGFVSRPFLGYQFQEAENQKWEDFSNESRYRGDITYEQEVAAGRVPDPYSGEVNWPVKQPTHP